MAKKVNVKLCPKCGLPMRPLPKGKFKCPACGEEGWYTS